MMRTWIWSALAVATMAGVSAVARPREVVAADAAKAAFIGPDGCKKCHFKQNSSWKKTPMAQSFEHLKPGQSAEKKTAAKLDPATDYTKDAKCLKCHVTGYGTESGYPALVEGKAFTPEEQARAAMNASGNCEACHGPGSLYSPYKKDHKDYKRQAVRDLGLTTPPTAEQCGVCHVKGGCPTMAADYAFDFEAAKKKEAAIHEHVPLKEKHE